MIQAENNSSLENKNSTSEVSDEDLKSVIADFLEMGHVENIIAMFKQELRYYDWTGDLLTDERFGVRLGVSVLMEELAILRPGDTSLALPSLVRQLNHKTDWVRGEVVSVLAIIGTQEAKKHIRTLKHDGSRQVREVVQDILDTWD